jgi:redox-sensitive bicupin YhaK (pirin superfamily)
MIELRRAAERGKTKTSWLNSNHTFSFGQYYDPEHLGFRDLLVINEDFVAPAQGFGTHGHQNMEILSLVIKGQLEHRDSTGGHGIIRPNELQRMSAGTGVRHSEFNPSATEEVHFLQIWILPQRDGLKPEYEQKAFPEDEKHGKLRVIASPDGADGSVTIHQDVRLYNALLDPGTTIPHHFAANRHGWLQVVRGKATVNGQAMSASDGAAISNEASINIHAAENSEVLLFDLR